MSLTRKVSGTNFPAVPIVRRLAALLLIVASLLMPGGSMPAHAAPGHAPAMIDCPHAALGVTAPLHRPAGTPVMPQCCYALPMATEVAVPHPLATRFLVSRPRPRSDTMPAPLAIGPEVPPPRT
jgi:hypothetical protein